MSTSTRSARTPDHALELERAYSEVGDRTWLSADFLELNLGTSRSLYTPDSLLSRRPRPRALDVVALVAGLPFPGEFIDPLLALQREISALFEDRLHYWVAPANLGIEFCVFKWPEEPWEAAQLDVVRSVVANIRRPAFGLDIRGVQINPDGCVVAKGFDIDAGLFEIRDYLRAHVPFLPRRQSGWAHVPMGRLLEPLGPERFVRLRERMRSLRNRPIAATEIHSMKLVHETRWYMEERQIVAEYPLETGSAGPAP
jgi:hypothetical protein